MNDGLCPFMEGGLSLKAAILLSLLISSTFEAQSGFMVEDVDDPKLSEAINNLHYELVECAVYYGIAEEALEKAGNKEGADIYRAIIEDIARFTITWHRPETTKAREKLARKEQEEKIFHSLSNISILINEYHEPCQSIYDNMDARLGYWLSL